MKKTFILTLFMMLCSFTFGQNETKDWWKMTNEDVSEGYSLNMTVHASFKIDDAFIDKDAGGFDTQGRKTFTLGAFCGNELRGITTVKVKKNEMVYDGNVYLTVYGNDPAEGQNRESIAFKAYVDGAVYVLNSYSIDFVSNGQYGYNEQTGESEPIDIKFMAENVVGTWGGIDFTLIGGELRIVPTTGTPGKDNSGNWTFKVGQWPEAVRYSSNGGAASIACWPYNKNSVTSLNIAEGVTSIGSFTAKFPNFTGEIVIPSTVEYIGQEAFQNVPATKLTFATVPEGKTGKELCIAPGAFKKLEIEEVSFPADRPFHLHAWLFCDCLKLKRVTIPATLTKMGGQHHTDYNHNPNSGNNSSCGIFVRCKAIEAITFGNAETVSKFYNVSEHNLGSTGFTKYAEVKDSNSERVSYCKNLHAAAYVAQDGDEIELVLDNTIASCVVIDKNVTLDLNGKTVKYASNESTPAFRVLGDVVVKNGTIKTTNDEGNNYCFIVGQGENSGKLTIESGMYDASEGGTSAVSVTRGELYIKGGEFISKQYAATNGSFNDWRYLINCNDTNYKAGDAKVAISGGCFHNWNPGYNNAEGPNTSFCADFYKGIECTNSDHGHGNDICYTVIDRYEAAIGQTYYETVEKAIEAAKEGETVRLLGNFVGENSKNEIITIDKAITLDGNGKTLTSTAGRAINVNCAGKVNIKNLTIAGSTNTERAINIIQKAAELTLNNVTAEGFKYTINVAASSVGSTINTVDCKFSGYAAVNITGDATKFTSENTEFVGVNNASAGSTNGFAAIVIGNYTSGDITDNVVVAINGGEVNCSSINGNAQYIVQVTAAVNAQVTVNAELTLCDEQVFLTNCIDEVMAKFPVEVADELHAQGYATSEADENGLVTVLGEAVAEVNETLYASLQAAVEAAEAGQTVTVVKSHQLASTVIINKSVELATAEDVQVTAPAYSYDNGVHTNPAAFRIVNDATVTINNFDITSGDNGLYNFILGASDNTSEGNLTINGGKFVANTTVASVTNGLLTITGGDFSLVEGTTDYRYLINCIDANYNNDLATVEIKGGTFYGFNPESNLAEGANTNFCPEGYGTEETESVYEVIKVQTRTLGNGWNWFSSYMTSFNGNEGLKMLQEALGESASEVKNHHYGWTRYNKSTEEWYGSLETVSVASMYMIKTNADLQLRIGEKSEFAQEVTITLKKGWNAIGYPATEKMNVESLFLVENSVDDYIKSKNGYASCHETEGWYGSLVSMTPGEGYMYYNAGAEKTITIPVANAQSRGEVRANITTENNYWVANGAAFANNMTITAVLNVNGVEMTDNYEVAAFVGDEVRGSARPIYVEALDRYVMFMTVYGEGNEELTFKYIDLDTYEVHSLNDMVVYSDNAIVGSLSKPMVLCYGTLSIEENGYDTMSLYPNPTTTGRAINLEAVCDMVEVFNSLGVKVAEYRNVETIDGIEAAGVYVIRVTNGEAVQNCRLIVK